MLLKNTSACVYCKGRKALYAGKENRSHHPCLLLVCFRASYPPRGMVFSQWKLRRCDKMRLTHVAQSSGEISKRKSFGSEIQKLFVARAPCRYVHSAALTRTGQRNFSGTIFSWNLKLFTKSGQVLPKCVCGRKAGESSDNIETVLTFLEWNVSMFCFKVTVFLFYYLLCAV